MILATSVHFSSRTSVGCSKTELYRCTQAAVVAQILVLTFCDLEVVGLNPAMCMAFFTSLSLLISSSISQLLLLSRSLKEEQNYRRLHQNRCLTVQLGANQANCANSLKPHEHLLLKVPKVELDLCMCRPFDVKFST